MNNPTLPPAITRAISDAITGAAKDANTPAALRTLDALRTGAFPDALDYAEMIERATGDKRERLRLASLLHFTAHRQERQTEALRTITQEASRLADSLADAASDDPSFPQSHQDDAAQARDMGRRIAALARMLS
jgi:hypothetical protein